MPLTKKGSKIMSSMKKTYGSAKKAKSVFYASKNAGKIKGVDATKSKDKNPRQGKKVNPVLSAAGKKSGLMRRKAALTNKMVGIMKGRK